jgi:hypothetical protein
MKEALMSVKPTGQALAQSTVLQERQIAGSLTLSLKNPRLPKNWLNVPQEHQPCVTQA